MMLLIVNVPFIDWYDFIKYNKKCLIVKSDEINNYDKQQYKILSMGLKITLIIINLKTIYLKIISVMFIFLKTKVNFVNS
jgi:hypothetical protein